MTATGLAVAATDHSVLRLGRTGTDQEVTARALHAGPGHSTKPCVATHSRALVHKFAAERFQ